jgi:hypothetical protein
LFFRKDYTYLREYNAFYKVHKSRLTFSGAVATCSAEGAQLFVPTSESETVAAFDLTNKTEIKWFWIGIHDLYGEGTFVTLDGEPLR